MYDMIVGGKCVSICMIKYQNNMYSIFPNIAGVLSKDMLFSVDGYKAFS